MLSEITENFKLSSDPILAFHLTNIQLFVSKLSFKFLNAFISFYWIQIYSNFLLTYFPQLIEFFYNFFCTFKSFIEHSYNQSFKIPVRYSFSYYSLESFTVDLVNFQSHLNLHVSCAFASVFEHLGLTWRLNFGGSNYHA